MLLLHVLLRASMWMVRDTLSAVLSSQLLSVQAGRRVGESLGARGAAGASAGRLPLRTRAESVHTWSQRPFLFPSSHFTTRAR